MSMKKKKQPSINYLDLIPQRMETISWTQDPKGQVILEIENKGIFNKIAQTVFRRPRYTKVHLETYGSFLWPLIDGQRTIQDLALLQKEQFGEEVEPLYPRIIKYFQIMESYHFIGFLNDNS